MNTPEALLASNRIRMGTMPQRLPLIIALTLGLTSGGGAAHASASVVNDRAGEGSHAQVIERVTVVSTAVVETRITESEDSAGVRTSVKLDLSDFQRKIGEILGDLGVSQENCRSFGPNFVVTPGSVRFESFAGSVFIVIGGTVTGWMCLENPVPNSKVDFEMRNLGLGIKTKVPVVKTWPGSPIKNIISRQGFSMSLPVFIRVEGRTGRLEVGPVRERGPDTILAAVPDSIATEIQRLGRSKSQAALDALDIWRYIPEGLRQGPFTIEDANISLDGDKLGISFVVAARMSLEAGRMLLERSRQP
jgi:hypothetical protein